MKKSFYSFFAVLGGLVLFFVLASCENFLKGAETRNELERLIREANAPVVNIYITADKETGEISPAGLYSIKLEKTFTLLFIPNKGYEFIKWEAVDKLTGQKIPDAVFFENPAAVETKARIIKNITNIHIKPVCIELPKIISKSPEKNDSGVYANMPVKCLFNQPMQDINGEPLIFDFSNIIIELNGENVNHLFNTPVLSNDKLTVTIKPDVKKLLEFISAKPFSTFDITVTFSPEIKTYIDGKDFKLYQNENISWTYRINKETKATTPVITQLNITNREKTSEKYSAANIIPPNTSSNEINEFTQTDVFSRRAGEGKNVYIYGTCYDAADGFQSIVVKEKRITDENAVILSDNGWTEETEYTDSKCKLISLGNGNYDFYIKHELKSLTGAVCIGVVVKDVVEKESESKDYTIIKYELTALKSDETTPINWVLNNPEYREYSLDGVMLTYDYLYNEVVFDKNDFDNNLKVLKFINPRGNFLKNELKNNRQNTWDNYTISEHLYGNIEIPETMFDIVCKYQSKNGIVESKMLYNKQEEYWSLELQTDFLSGLQLDFTITDDMDAKESRTYVIPDNPKILDKVNNSLIFNCSNTGNSLYVIKKNYDEDGTTIKNTYAYNTTSSVNQTLTLSEYTEHDYTGQCFFRNGGLSGHMISIDTQIIPEINNSLPFIQIGEAVIGEPDKNGKCLVSLPLSIVDSENSIWQEFYSILYNFNSEPNNNDRYELATGVNELCFYYSGQKLYDKNLYITVLGIKNGEKTQDFKQTIKALKESQPYNPGFDIIPPVIIGDWSESYPSEQNILLYNSYKQFFWTSFNSRDSVSYNYILPVLCIVENETDIKSINWWTDDIVAVRDDYKIYNSFPGTPSVALPLCDLNLDREYVSFFIEVKDYNNNSSIKSMDVRFKEGPEVVPSVNGNNLELICYSNTQLNFWDTPTTGSVLPLDYGTRFVLYSLSDSRDSWSMFVNKKPVSLTSSFEDSKYIYNDTIDITGKTNDFIKIIVEPIDQIETYGEFYKIKPLYFYTGSIGLNMTNIFIEQPDGVSISSDNPVFVHTISTKSEYDVCKNWTVEQWEYNHKESGLAFFEPPEKNNFFPGCFSENYKIDYSSINSGDYFVIIAHFANGSIRMSEIRQKK